MLVQYGKKIHGRYGLPMRSIQRPGFSLLSAENLRTGRVWQWFMANPEAERALDLAGLVKVRDTLQAPKLIAPGTQ